MRKKKVIKTPVNNQKQVNLKIAYRDTGYPVFRFDRIDKSGDFAFDTSKENFSHKDFLDKMIAYSNMTWFEIMRQTHDAGKSKHHYLSNPEKLSKQAKMRLKNLALEDMADSLFSFAFNNILRIVGLVNGDDFHVLWYDVNHEVYPSKKKHT